MAPPPIHVAEQPGHTGPRFPPLENGPSTLHSLNYKRPCLRLWWSLHVSTPRRRPPPGGSAFEALCGQSLPPATQASAGSSDTSHSPRISRLFCACRLECFSCIHLCLWTSSSYCLLTRQSRPDIKLSPFFFFFLSILFKYNIYRRA